MLVVVVIIVLILLLGDHHHWGLIKRRMSQRERGRRDPTQGEMESINHQMGSLVFDDVTR